MRPRKKPLKPFPKMDFSNARIIEGQRFQSAVSPQIAKIAKRFQSGGADSIRDIANFVVESTPVKETLFETRKRFSRRADEVIRQGYVDLLHCYDRCHLMISLLAAKRIPSWIVLEMDYRNLVHAYVETTFANVFYTIDFRTDGWPTVAKGTVEEAVKHNPGCIFIRGRDLGDLGVFGKKGFERLVEALKLGKAKGTIELK